MRESAKNVIWKLYYSISANLVNFLISLFVAFVIPKFLGLEQYGYWQLYIFYVGYVGFFHFGHPDGVYLRYGGKYYDELDKSLLHSQFVFVIFLEILVLVGFILFSFSRINNLNRAIVVIATGVNCLLMLPRVLLQFILQGTGRIREYAKNFILERLIYIILLVIFLAFGIHKFEYMIIADVFAKFVALLEIGWICKDIVFVKSVRLKIAFHEFFVNVSAGINLLFANIASLLIIGIVRFGIERSWDVITFGKVSFSLSISNFVISFIYAVGIVVFPIIKRSDPEKLPLIYNTLGTLLSGSMIFLLITYFPIQKLLLLWLPEYHEAIHYFAILFPISIFEARSSLLINTYLKALREERAMLLLNVITVLFSMLVTFVVVLLLKSLILSIFSILLLVICKSILPDLYLQRKMGILCLRDGAWNVFATIEFVYCNWYVGGMIGWLVFISLILFMIIIRRREFSSILMNFKENFGSITFLV